ncbi:hypothetical protein BJ875DRAFT_449932 [Amylocarpus encephaloides]|uniref:Uncharacterized protein n=1 Tax=Amylocarpus encephaloides TaxID=45428 RepID=A0A9P7YSU7_9HELO|nr:hypothetical protein BJ875DRAFT_449932 [Amylocarpus encephaloides]
MPASSKVCCRAVQSRLPLPRPLWISDEALNEAFQRFSRVSNTSKRYGSFVPGPLESRRRLGKRRMAYSYASEPPQTTPSSLGGFWKLFQTDDPDRTKFHYEPPTLRVDTRPLDGFDPPLRERDTMTLPAYTAQVVEVDKVRVAAQDQTLEKEELVVQISAGDFPSKSEIYQFQIQLRSATDGLPKICKDFSNRLKQSLMAGEVSDDALQRVLGWRLKGDLQQTLSKSVWCLQLCQSIWDGLSRSEVRPLASFEGATIDKLLGFMSCGSMGPKTEKLAISILHSLSSAQLTSICEQHSLSKLVTSWIQYCCLTKGKILKSKISRNKAKAKAHTRVGNLTARLELVEKLVASVGLEAGDRSAELNTLKGHLEKASGLLITSIHAIDAWAMTAQERSIANLAEALGKISDKDGNLLKTIKSCTLHIRGLATNSTEFSKKDLRFCWMSVLAQIPHVDDSILMATWKTLGFDPDREPFFNDIFIKHLISSRMAGRSKLVGNTFEALQASGDTVNAFVQAVKRHGDSSQQLTSVLDEWMALTYRLDSKLVKQQMYRLQAAGLRLSPDALSKLLYRVQFDDPRKAAEIYQCWRSTLRVGRQPGFIFEHSPTVILSLISKTTMPLKAIWEALNMPRYENLAEGKVPDSSNKLKGHLSPQMQYLLMQMAIEFANSPFRSRRVALRSVVQCLHYLRVHRCVVPRNVSRALTHAGLTRPLIDRRGRIGKHRLRWALGVIDSIEGREVAKNVNDIVFHAHDGFLRRQYASLVARKRVPMGIKLAEEERWEYD